MIGDERTYSETESDSVLRCSKGMRILKSIAFEFRAPDLTSV